MFITMSKDTEPLANDLLMLSNRKTGEKESLIRFETNPSFKGIPITELKRITLVGHSIAGKREDYFGRYGIPGTGSVGYTPKQLAKKLDNNLKEIGANRQSVQTIDLLSCEGGLSQYGRPTYAEQFALSMSKLGYDITINVFKADLTDKSKPEIARIVNTSLYSPPEENGKLYFCCFDKEGVSYLDSLDDSIKQYITKLNALNAEIITVRDKYEVNLIKLLSENGHGGYKAIDLASRQDVDLLLKKLNPNAAKQWDNAYEQEIGPLIKNYLELDKQHQDTRAERSMFYKLNAVVETEDVRTELNKEKYAIHYKPETSIFDKMKNIFGQKSNETSSAKNTEIIDSSMTQMLVQLGSEEQAKQAAIDRKASPSSTSSEKVEQGTSAKATTASLSNKAVTSTPSANEINTTESSPSSTLRM